MLAGLHRWWHEGEDRAIRIYVKGYLVFLIVTPALVGLSLSKPIYRHPVVLLVSGATILRAAIEARRAIIFTDNSVIYRPPFGHPKEIRLSDVRELKKTRVLISLDLRPEAVTGVEFTLKDGTIIAVPLDLPGRKEILERLKVAIADLPGRPSSS